jgi:hypothetical protein
MNQEGTELFELFVREVNESESKAQWRSLVGHFTGELKPIT